MTTGRRMTTAVVVALTGLALTACTAPATSGAEGSATPTESVGSTPTSAPIGDVDLPEGADPVMTWTDQVGAPEPQTVRLIGQPLMITVSVACDSADATVTIEVEGLMTGGSTCYYDEATTRGPGGGNTSTMHLAVDQDARIVVTTDPADVHWSGAVSTGTPG